MATGHAVGRRDIRRRHTTIRSQIGTIAVHSTGGCCGVGGAEERGGVDTTLYRQLYNGWHQRHD